MMYVLKERDAFAGNDRSVLALKTKHMIEGILNSLHCLSVTKRKLSCHWQTRAMRKHAKNCSHSTCFVSFHRIPFWQIS